VNFPPAPHKIFINITRYAVAAPRPAPISVDIHGQGDQQTLFNPDTHLECWMHSPGASGVAALRQDVAESYLRWRGLKRELEELQRDEAEKFSGRHF